MTICCFFFFRKYIKIIPNVYLHGAKISSNLVGDEISYSSFRSGILRETPRNESEANLVIHIITSYGAKAYFKHESILLEINTKHV